MKTKGRPVHGSEAFLSSRKLPALLLSHPSAEIRAQKSRAPSGSTSLVQFRSIRVPEGASLSPTSYRYFRYHRRRIYPSLEIRYPVHRCLSRRRARDWSVFSSVSPFLVNLINASLCGWTRKMLRIRQQQYTCMMRVWRT